MPNVYLPRIKGSSLSRKSLITSAKDAVRSIIALKDVPSKIGLLGISLNAMESKP